MSPEQYLLADQPSELERLQLQSRVWEPSGRQLPARLDDGSGLCREAEREVAEPGGWGTTFTLIQSWGRRD